MFSILNFTSDSFQVDEDQMKKILSMIKSGKDQGARLLVGGDRHGDRGYFVQPTVFSDVADNMTIAQEEVSDENMSFCLKRKNWLFGRLLTVIFSV